MGQVRPRDRERVKHHPAYLSTGQPRSQDVAQLVNALHPEPAAQEDGTDQDDLMKSLHHTSASRRAVNDHPISNQ
jgi:hypothetical protein